MDGSAGEYRLQLWFEQCRDIALMALALAGGGITLLGSIFASSPKKASALVSIVFFAASAVTALYAQTQVVSLADAGRWPGRDMQRLRSVAFGLIAAGCGAFLTFAFSALQRMQAP